MADLPRDPRQLARDILSGKVRIEDLARERQLRAPGGTPPAGPRVPDKIPLPRTPQRVPPYQPPRPQQRPIPPVRPGPAQRPSGPYQRPQPPRPAPQPVQRQAPRPPVKVPQPQTIAKPAPAPGPGSAPPVVARRPVRIQQLVRSKLALRQGILLAEILGPPVSERW